MYDPSKQYRCTIIRGKSQKEMDDLVLCQDLVQVKMRFSPS